MILILILCLSVFQSTQAQITCSKCHELQKDKKIIHIVPHSHWDAGWLQTFDQYYENDIRSVRTIINSVIKSLYKDPRRRFTVAETCYLWKWWKEYKNKRYDIRKLVEEGRLEIVNGGWVMNDEATTDYQSIIDQFTLGFRILHYTIGMCATPQIGWQIDTFGHSIEQASLMYRMGYRGLILGRIHFLDKIRRLEEGKMEFHWLHNNKSAESLFTTILPRSYSTTTIQLKYDWLLQKDYSKFKNRRYNENDTDYVRKYSSSYLTNNLLLPIGSDFAFQFAETDFAHIDEFIRKNENNPHLQLVYSTPYCYFKAVREELRQLPNSKLKIPREFGDFFPYADRANSYWTGYYSSRGTLKRLSRKANAILQCTKQLLAFGRTIGEDREEKMALLSEAVAILQHHDAITGTARAYVVQDYVSRLCAAIRMAEEAVSDVIGYLHFDTDDS